MILKLYLLLFITVAITFSSCKTTPGEGGNAQIKGTFWVRNYDPLFTYVVGRYPAINTSVYIFYGDDTSPGSSVKTNANGEFAFTYLRTGKYRIVAYSKQKATSTVPGEFPLETYVFLNSKSEIKDIGLDTLNQ